MPEKLTRKPALHSVDGAPLVIVPDKGLPIVWFAIALRLGAVADPQGKSGRGRVMLELLLRGTAQKTRQGWNAAFERLGSQVSVSMGNELGLIRGITLKRNLQATFALLNEALTAPGFADSEREPLLKEMCEALKSERDDDDSAAEVFLRRALYPKHLLGRAPSGALNDLPGLTSADARAAYEAHLSRTGLVFGFAGDIDVEEASRLVRPLLAAMPERPLAKISVPTAPEPAGLRVVVVDKPSRSQVQLRVGRPTLGGQHPEVHAFWLGIVAFGGTFTSPFTREVRDQRGWSYTAHADFSRRRLYGSPLVLRTAPAVGDVLDCLALELELYAQLARGELPAGSVEFARSYLLNRHPFEIATADDQLIPALQNELLGLAIDDHLHTPEYLEALDEAKVQKALRAHLHPERVVVVMVATASELVPKLKQRFPHADLSVVDYREP